MDQVLGPFLADRRDAASADRLDVLDVRLLPDHGQREPPAHVVLAFFGEEVGRMGISVVRGSGALLAAEQANLLGEGGRKYMTGADFTAKLAFVAVRVMLPELPPRRITAAPGRWSNSGLMRLCPNPGISAHGPPVKMAFLCGSTRKEEKNMVYSRIVAQTIIAIAVSCLLHAPNVSLAADKAEEGFVSLFDGKTLDGWHLMNGAKFVVEDGVIKHDVGLGWLRSDKKYADFILRLEFRFMKPKQDGGVFLRSVKEGKNWPDQKYEVQVENTRRMATIFGAKHDLNVQLVQKVLKPDREWNEYDIKIVGSRIDVRLNGEPVTTSDSADALKRGYLGLQGENGTHEYRNIRIKDLSK